MVDPDAIPQVDAPAEEALPPQEEYWRAPAQFGAVLVDAYPKGYDRYQGFRKLYPRIDLPILYIDPPFLAGTTTTARH